jgi:hypothetical protein
MCECKQIFTSYNYSLFQFHLEPPDTTGKCAKPNNCPKATKKLASILPGFMSFQQQVQMNP